MNSDKKVQHQFLQIRDPSMARIADAKIQFGKEGIKYEDCIG